VANVLVRFDRVAGIGSGAYSHPNFRFWACLLFVLLFSYVLIFWVSA
jgi:hypothetical protein